MLDFDEKFIKELKKQDHNAFNTFYIKTVDVFFRYINSNYYFNKEDIEDIISDFYVKVWDAVKKYDEKLSFPAYIWTILKNTIKDALKKNNDLSFSSLDKEDAGDSFADQIADETDLTLILEQNFKFEQIEVAIKELDDLSKDIIYLKFIEEKNNDEIEKILGLSQENIRQKISRAIKYLKSLLESNN
ncbi:MAG: sigma-70 family RNA polymerase sigma factor [Candidatus Absconditicoccaceae bacterium]